MDTQPERLTKLKRVGLRKIAAALAAVKRTEPPKYAYVFWMRSFTYCGHNLQINKNDLVNSLQT